MGVDEVGPLGDLVNTTSELERDGVADVGEFAVFEDEEVLFVRYFAEFLWKLGGEVCDDVDVGL